MITIKNKASIRKMEEAGKLLSQVVEGAGTLMLPGISTLEIDAWIERELTKRGLVPRCKGYMGYRHVSCISVNDEVVHGVPSEQRVLQNGDVVKVDVVASWKGYCADMARAFFVGESCSQDVKKLVLVAQKALDKGISLMRPGNRLGDVSAAIQEIVEAHGFGVVRDFAGHGIGKQMHEDPELLNYGKKGTGPEFKPGMALAVEPMITMGHYDVYVTDDGWTVKTSDNSIATHVEDTVIVTEGEPKIITRCNGKG